MRTTPVARTIALGAVVAVLAACGTGSESSSDSTSSSSGSGGPVTISWWHNSNTDPGKATTTRWPRTSRPRTPA